MRASISRDCRILSCASLLLLGACAGGDVGGEATLETDVPEEQRYGGAAVIGAYGDLLSMNSLASTDFNSGQIQREVLFMPLVKYDENTSPIPWLAERWDTVRVAPDSLELTFHLRRDIRWHDGEPTTAEDVRFTFERAIDPRTAFANASVLDPYSRRVEVVDPYTIRFRLKPHAEFLDIWYQTPVMPEHILGDVPPEEMIGHPFGTQRPVGNGPFRFVRRAPGQEWVFEANPDFPEALGGRPYLDQLVWRYIPEQTTLLAELLTGGIDVYLAVGPDQVAQIEASRVARVLTYPTRQWVYIGWNTRLPMFDTAEERRALTLAIDRREIVDALLFGLGDVGRATVTSSHWAFAGDDPETLVPHDPEEAKRLLSAAGWEDRDGDGVREDAAGRPFRFTLITNEGNDLRRDITEIVQAQLREVGVAVEVRLLEFGTMTELLRGSLNARGERVRNFQAVVGGWVDYIRKDDAEILHSRNLNNPFQYVGYASPRVDALIDTLGVLVDREAARPLWHEYQRLMARELPYTPIYYPLRPTGVHNRMRGVEMDEVADLKTVTRWWILPEQRRGRGPARADTTTE